MGDYTLPKLIPLPVILAGPGGLSDGSLLVVYTKHKLADIKRSILANCENVRDKERHAASKKATLACAAYLAHARRELSYDTIVEIIWRAGGSEEALDGIRQHLEDWRERGGYTEEELSCTKVKK